MVPAMNASTDRGDMTSERFKTIQTGGTGMMTDDGRLVATSATRNVDAIVSVLSSYVPPKGRALEIASGSGQHITRYAAEFPRVHWQPSDLDPVKIASIKSWVEQSGLANLADPVTLDASKSGWAADYQPLDLIVIVNLLHLISAAEMARIVVESSKALAQGGALLIYGPFLRGDRFASDGDERFHHSLSTQDPDIGYKSFESVQAVQAEAGLSPNAPHEMPANNLMLSARKL